MKAIDFLPPPLSAAEIERDERYAAQKMAIDKETDERRVYELQTQMSLYLERHWYWEFYRDANLRLVPIPFDPSDFVVV